jgi:hypothetical protein
LELDRQQQEEYDQTLLEDDSTSVDVESGIGGLDRLAEGHETASYLDDEGAVFCRQLLGCEGKLQKWKRT